MFQCRSGCCCGCRSVPPAHSVLFSTNVSFPLASWLLASHQQSISLQESHHNNHPLQSARLSCVSPLHSFLLCSISVDFQAIPTSPVHFAHMHMEKRRERGGEVERGREGRREEFLSKQELVRRAITAFIAVSITASHWGLFYTSGNIKQLDRGGEWWALHRLLLALIYLFVQQEARHGPSAIRGFLSQQSRSKGSLETLRL